MRILINALSARQRGGQTYLINLLRFIPTDGSIEALLLGPSSLQLGYDHPYITRVRVPRALENPFARAAWEMFALPRLVQRSRADILFCPGGLVTTEPRGCRIVTMSRNIIPFDLAQRRRYPVGYERFRNWLLNKLMMRSMTRADLVIFISEYARELITRQANDRRIRSVVIPHGIAPQFTRPTGDAAAVERFGARPYLLYVSYLDFYKAQLEVVQAFALLKEQRATTERLLLVGPENPAYGNRVRREIERLGLSGEVIVTGALPYSDLPALYRHATVNIFASESENCPNILLEAMGAGRPVVCSSRAPMPEFAGDAVLYFDPSAPADLAAKLCTLLQDQSQMEGLGARAKQHARLYDWEATARRTFEAMKHVLVSETPACAGGHAAIGERH